MAIKFEIIHEGRVELDGPTPGDEICGVRTLTRVDQHASKLLANDDRWADTSTFSRGVIDLALLAPDTAALTAEAQKAVGAYGRTVGKSLAQAVDHLRKHPRRLADCTRALKVDVPPAAVSQRIRDLSARCARIDGLGRPLEKVQDPRRQP